MRPGHMRAHGPDTGGRNRLLEFIQDAAVRGLPDTGALLAQRFQLLLQLAQLADSGGDMSDVLIEQRVDLAALGLRFVIEAQQHADLV